MMVIARSSFQLASVSTRPTALGDRCQVRKIAHRESVNPMGRKNLFRVPTNELSSSEKQQYMSGTG